MTDSAGDAHYSGASAADFHRLPFSSGICTPDTCRVENENSIQMGKCKSDLRAHQPPHASSASALTRCAPNKNQKRRPARRLSSNPPAATSTTPTVPGSGAAITNVLTDPASSVTSNS